MSKLKNKLLLLFLLIISSLALANIASIKESFYNQEKDTNFNSLIIPDYERIAITQWINKHKGKNVNLDIDKYIDSVFLHAEQNKIDPYLIFGLTKKESTFNPNVVSSAGAIGLTQVIPKWHPKEVNKRNLKDQEVGVEVGALVIKKYINIAKGNLRKALTLYSGGATNYHDTVINNSNSLKSHVRTYELAYRQTNQRVAYFDTSKIHIDFHYVTVEQKLQKFDSEFSTFLTNSKLQKEKQLDILFESIQQRT